MTTALPNPTKDMLVEPAPAGLTRSGSARLDAIDMLRGLVIVLMVIDHVRDFFLAGTEQNPTDPATTFPALYATRWITHLCAPTFVFLAGLSILFQKANGKVGSNLTRFLLLRGVWLIVLECTVVSFGFNFGEPFVSLEVLWVIGLGMICVSLISRLPTLWVLALGVTLILLSPGAANATAGVTGSLATLRLLALVPGVVPQTPILIMYSLVPWLGIMCLGYGLGPVFQLPAATRRRRVFALALGLLLTFAVLRLVNGFGDPIPWTEQANAVRTGMSFLNVAKYPPSPDFVAVTLGFSLLLFIALERLRGPAARVLLDFGRTPLFTYLAHIYIAHGLMLIVAMLLGIPDAALDVVSRAMMGGAAVHGWGFSLATVYLISAVVIALLIPLSRWFADVKRRRRDWWLGYI